MIDNCSEKLHSSKQNSFRLGKGTILISKRIWNIQKKISLFKIECIHKAKEPTTNEIELKLVDQLLSFKNQQNDNETKNRFVSERTLQS